MKSLLNELEELREKREAAGLQSDHVSLLKIAFARMKDLSLKC